MKRVEISREIGYINEISDEEIVLKAKGGNKLAQEKIINKFLEKRTDVTSKQTENITTLNSKNTSNVLQRKISILLENINLKLLYIIYYQY